MHSPGERRPASRIFHAYTPLPDIDVTASPENVKMRSGMTYLSTELKEKEEALTAVGDMLVESGFDRDAVSCVFKKRVKSAAEEIVDKVAGCNVLVLSRGRGQGDPFFHPEHLCPCGDGPARRHHLRCHLKGGDYGI
jgi:hypothetical protein